MTVRRLLPGFTSAAPAGAISFIAYTNTSATNSYSTSTSLVLHSSILSNDIILLVVSAGNSNSNVPPVQTLPTGFTLINSQTSTNDSMADAEGCYTYFKIASSTDASSTVTIAHDSANYRRAVALVYRTTKVGTPSFSTSSLSSFGSQSTLSTPPNQTVNSGSTSVPRVVVAVYLNAHSRNFSPVTPTEVSTGGGALDVKFYIFNGTGSDVVVSCTTAATTIVMQSFYFTL